MNTSDNLEYTNNVIEYKIYTDKRDSDKPVVLPIKFSLVIYRDNKWMFEKVFDLKVGDVVNFGNQLDGNYELITNIDKNPLDLAEDEKLDTHIYTTCTTNSIEGEVPLTLEVFEEALEIIEEQKKFDPIKRILREHGMDDSDKGDYILIPSSYSAAYGLNYHPNVMFSEYITDICLVKRGIIR